MSNGISIFHPRTETFLIFIFPDFLPWLTVAGLHFIVKKTQFVAEFSPGNACVPRNLAIQNYSTCRCHGDVVSLLGRVVFPYVCTSLQTFRCMFIPDGCHKFIGFAKEANFWFIPVLSISGAPDYVDQLLRCSWSHVRAAQSPPKDGLVWFSNDLLFRTPSFGWRQDRTCRYYICILSYLTSVYH